MSAPPIALTAAWHPSLLLIVLALAAALRLWNLEQNGWGAEYYSAAVRSMALNGRNFFYAAFDPAGFISVDKPPLALWLQVASVKLFGWRPFALMLPQVLAGVASVWVLYRIVRRTSGPAAGLLAALLLAITPVLVAIHRTNNMDSALVLALLLAAWALVVAMQTGRRRWLCLSMAALGLAFNVKMLAAFIVLPAFALAHLLMSPTPWSRRLTDWLVATPVLAATALCWVLAVEFTTPQDRPWVGSSRTNSMLELIVGHNGLGRFVSLLRTTPRPAAAQAQPRAPDSPSAPSEVAPSAGGLPEPLATAPRGPRSLLSRLFVRAPAGPLRLLSGQLAAQTGWMLPLALAGLLACIVVARRQPVVRGDTSQAHPLGGPLFWAGWLAVTGLVFSSTGGIMHFYYLAVMAPALAALAGMGLPALWRLASERPGRAWAWLLPAALLATGLWQWHVHASALDGALWPVADSLRGWSGTLVIAMLSLVLAGGALLVLTLGRFDRACLGASTAMMAGLLVLPAAWALSSVLTASLGLLPSADLQRLIVAREGASGPGRFGQLPDTTRLVTWLRGQRSGERYLLATSSTYVAAPIIVQFGDPVMARGGFHGVDPAMPLERFVELVRRRELRFAMLGDLSLVSRRIAQNLAPNPVAEWIRAHGRPVDPALWRDPRLPAGSELFDLRPPPD